MGFFLFVFNFFFFFKFFFLFFYFFFYFFFKFFSYIFSLCPIPFCPIPCPYPLTPNQIRVRDGIANWAPGPVASSYYYSSSSCRSKQWLKYGTSFQDISMNLAGHIGHGPSSWYPDLWPDMSCCHGIMTENVLKNGQMYARIVKSQEEMAKIHSYHNTWLRGLKIFWYKFFRWPLTWPRYRSKVRTRLKPISSLGFLHKITKLIIQVLHSDLPRMVDSD